MTNIANADEYSLLLGWKENYTAAFISGRTSWKVNLLL